MKRFLFIFGISLFPGLSSAQSIVIPNVSFAAEYLTSLNFTYSHIDQVLNGKALDIPGIGGAIKLTVCSNSNGATVKANISYNSGPGGAPQAWVRKTLVSDTYSNAQTIASSVDLTGSQQFLLNQPGSGTFYYYYNLSLNPLTSFVSAGEYGYTIHYTMTTP